MAANDDTAPEPAARPSRRLVVRRLLPWVLLALLAAAGLGRSLWTPDEPREAEISREMYLAPGVIPTLDGTSFYEKPPLYYWLVAGLFSLTGGPSIAAARAVSALAGFLTLLVLYLWGRRATNPKVALFAVVMLATSVQFLYTTHWVLLDPLLMLFCSMAAWAGWELVSGTGGRGFLALLLGSLALALWTKGLVGPVLVVAGLAVFSALERRRRPWRRLHPGITGAFLALVVASVCAAFYLDGGWEALRQLVWVNHVERLVRPQGTGHVRPFYYYLTAVPEVVLPWLVPFLDLFRPAYWRRSRPSAMVRRYAAALALGGVAVLSLAATKRENYLLPLLAPLFLLLALAVEDRLRAWREEGPSHGWQRAGEWLQAGLLALVAVVPGAAVIAYTRQVLSPALVALACGLAAAAGLLIATGRRHRAVVRTAAAAAAVFVAGALLVAVPQLEARKDFTGFVKQVDQRLPAGQPVYTVGADETVRGIVPFLTGRKLVLVSPADLRRRETGAGGAAPPPFLLVQVKDRRRQAPPDLGSRYRVLESATFGRGRELSLWRRTPPSGLSHRRPTACPAPPAPAP